jgi:hypothetical protein
LNALVNPSVRQIVAQVDVVLSKDPAANVIGIRAQGQGDWPPMVRVGDRDFVVAWCPSPISVREQLVLQSRAGSEDAQRQGLVVMTPLGDRVLGADVLGRLSRGKVFSVETWDMVRHAFQARDIDSRLARWPWVAEALLENLPAGGYPPARGGLLDVDTAWAHVLRAVLGLSGDHGGRPDLAAILRWSLSPEAARRYGDLPEKARRQIGLWLTEVLGGCGKLIEQIFEAGSGGDLMPIALVCGMVLKPGQGSTVPHELLAAAVRLERFTGGVPVSAREGLRIHAAAVRTMTTMDYSSLTPILDRADRLIESLHLLGLAQVSDDLPSGLNARLVSFAEAIGSFLQHLKGKGPSAANESATTVFTLGQRVLEHRLAVHQGYRVRRVEMAMRLVRWLTTAERQGAHNFGDWVTDYGNEGAFVDWARLTLLDGDELADVSLAYGALRETARARRESQNRQFALSLAGWNSSGCPAVSGVLPVERIVADALAPVAATVPVLLLVADGLSFPIYRELIEDAQRQGWTEVLPEGQTRSAMGIATIPSVTEVSRASLFNGSLVQGQAANEKSWFAQHPALMPLSLSGRAAAKPVLFHKADLTSGSDGSSLSNSVRDAIASRERKVVAIVFNGIDDHLSGSDQLNQRWTLDDLRLIKPLLYEARNAGRLVLLTADHGHLIDEATVAWDANNKALSKASNSGSGDRWRSLTESSNSQEEIVLSGGRVLAPNGQSKVVVPWSETLRYGTPKNGYHGGVSLQEMVVPVSWLATSSSIPEGFVPAPYFMPYWWDVLLGDLTAQTQSSGSDPVAAAKPATKKTKSSATLDSRQPALFEMPVPAAEAPASSPDAIWIDALLASQVFQAQKQWAARAAIRDDEMRRLLEALAERGGRLSKAALAGRLSMPLMRVSGFVNSARRLLNVDQSPVLVLDESEGSVSLNRALLDVQFQLNKGSKQ